MPIHTYHFALIDGVLPGPYSTSCNPSISIADTETYEDASPTMSSQIFLSRGVAGSEEPPTLSATVRQTTVASIFESNSSHIMTLGDAAASTVSSQRGSTEEPSQDSEPVLIEKLQSSSTTDITVQSSKSFFSERSSKDYSPKSLDKTPASSQDVDIEGHTLDKQDNSPDCPPLPPTPGLWKGKGKEVSRGRSPERQPRSYNPLGRAESRSRRNDAAIEIDARRMERRAVSRSSTFHELPDVLEAVLDDKVLEPCPHIPVCDNVSEVLNTTSETGTASNATLRRIHTDSSLSNLRTSKTSHPQPISSSTIPQLRPSIIPGPGLHPERASRSWPNNVTVEHLLGSNHASPCEESVTDATLASAVPESLASTLPAEILQQIYLNLSPADFNSARRSCQAWFIHSLSKPLLELFLRRMGCSNIICDDPLSHQASSEDIAKYEWNLSKRLARECALGPNWSGNGIERSASSECASNTAFRQASNVDFTDVAAYFPRSNSTEIIFTVSNCGKFLMVANGYANEKPGSLRPVTSIICPNRVLACSMDTSSQRHAIAILLEGRMGVVCDITALGNDNSSPDSWDEYGEGYMEFPKHKRTSESEKGRPCQGTPYKYFGSGNTSPNVGRSAWQELFREDSLERSSAKPRMFRQERLPQLRIVSSGGSSSHYDLQNTMTMPCEEGTRSMYRNLCSADDPPRSVAICPQRRCVAFGCSSGIELHWVDALTGQNLNRWFPLTAPSDFLYFLPPRQNVDSAKKLRLISSTEKPSDQATNAEKPGAESGNRSYWKEISQEMRRTDQADRHEAGSYRMNPRTSGGYRRRYTAGRNDTSDHYRAVPLSDGYHILFTDPQTGLLCLGSDAPLGGPTKLLRKIWFQSPEGFGTPTAYAGGSDLNAGIRVVAAFGTGEQQSIYLYSVPGDIFSTSQNEPSIVVGPMMQPGASKNDANTDWMAWWPDDGLQEWLKHKQNPVPGVVTRGIWPVKIKGQEIGRCSAVSDLTINSGPNMVVWAFGKDGSTMSWAIDNGRDQKMRSFSVARDGSVKEIVEADSESPVVSEPEIFCMSPDSMDGAGEGRSEAHRTKRRRLMVDTPPPDDITLRFDADGDVVMTDADDVRVCEDQRRVRKARRFVEEEYLEELVVDGEMMVRKMVRRYDEEVSGDMRRQRRVCVVVEEVMGVTRLDLEIR